MADAKPHKFGWCMDGDHENCRKVTSEWYGRVWHCSCECHKPVE